MGYYGDREVCRQRARSVDRNYEETSGERGFVLSRLDGLLEEDATAMRWVTGGGGRPSPAGPSELSRRA